MTRISPMRAAAVAVVFVVSCVVSLARAETVSPEPFFRHADYGAVRLSPSGRYLAALVPVRGRLAIAVLDLDTNTSSIPTAMEDRDVSTFWWVNDDRLVFSIVDLQSGLGEQRDTGLFAVNRDGSEYRVLARPIEHMAQAIQWVYRYTALHSTLRDGSDDVIVVANDNNYRYPDIYRMNTKNARKTPLWGDSKPGDVVHWVADRDGAVRACVVALEGGRRFRVYYRKSADAPWELLREFAMTEPGLAPVAFDGDGTLIVGSRPGRDTEALYRFDVATGKLGDPIAAHPTADLSGGLVYDWRSKRIVGIAYDGERPGAVWFDEEWAKVQASVDASLPGMRNELSRGTARSRVLVFSYSDTDPGSYYLYEPEKRRLEFLASVRKAIDPAKMSARTPVRYTARDGLAIPAYLALPKDKDAKNLPLVVYVHGGPYMRGTHWRWDPEAAWLATQGYAVLQPEFRGSQGWGFKLYQAGWKQWGRAMQDDLDDGVDWLAKQGTIDPDRVCIMGASYGGYAVMMGLARDPQRWRCGVDYLGVTDINLMFDVTWSDTFNSDWMRFTAKDLIGDPDKDAAMLKAASPLENANRIKAPVLMAYGGSDRRVPIIHGERMRNALESNHTPVEWIVYPDEGHGFMQEKVRMDFHNRVAKFLEANLGAAR